MITVFLELSIAVIYLLNFILHPLAAYYFFSAEASLLLSYYLLFSSLFLLIYRDREKAQGSFIIPAYYFSVLLFAHESLSMTQYGENIALVACVLYVFNLIAFVKIHQQHKMGYVQN